MALNKFQENDVTYFQFYANCPVCSGEGRQTPESFWKHGDNNCFGDMYLGDNAFFKCEKCGRSSHVRNWKYLCPSHSNSIGYFVTDSIALSSTEIPEVVAVIAVAGQLTEDAGIYWLQRFMENSAERRGV